MRLGTYPSRNEPTDSVEEAEMKRFGLVVVLLGSTLATPARAGVVDSPLPAPFTQHVFTVPGIIQNGASSTFFSCTNLDAVDVTIGVETFASLGGGPSNDAAATSLSVTPGATVMFGMSSAAGYSISSNLAAGGMSKGSARILATSKKIACTAWVADVTNDPPTSSFQLTIIAKTKQKASN
jgi:hypothetical protein